MSTAIKRVGISFIYSNIDAGYPDIINIINGFNNMLSDLPPDIRQNIDNIEFKVEGLDDGRLDKSNSV